MDEASAHYEGSGFQQFHMGILLSFTPPKKKKITKKDSEGNCVQYWWFLMVMSIRTLFVLELLSEDKLDFFKYCLPAEF